MIDYQTKEKRLAWVESLKQKRWCKVEGKEEVVVYCCPSCNTPYQTHLGLIDTCKRLQDAEAELKYLRMILTKSWGG